MNSTEKSITGYEPKVTLINAPFDPDSIIAISCDITMKPQFNMINNLQTSKIKGTVKNLLTMNHTSLFEHIHYTFFIQNITRSLLAQITRHRIGSFTSSSQHYQEYDQHYGFSIDKKHIDNIFVVQAINQSIESYKILRRAGVSKEEARQVLPNAIHVNLLWSVNARSLINFLNLRMCKRNVLEMRLFAMEIHEIVKKHFPTLFNLIGPDCFMTQCRQGKMSCQK